MERHLDLVYFTALRRCGGDAHSAQDVTLQVFTSLARPMNNIVHVFQLAAETGMKAAAIHDDATLAAEGKRAALAALQQGTRPQLDALVPPELQSKLDDHAITWFRILGEGRYQIQRPILIGGGWSFGPEIPVGSPPPPRPSTPLVRAIR